MKDARKDALALLDKKEARSSVRPKQRGAAPRASRVGRPLNASKETATVLELFKDGTQHYGYDISKVTGLRPGTVYPMLRRLAEQGVLTARWEAAESVDKPPRKVYKLKT